MRLKPTFHAGLRVRVWSQGLELGFGVRVRAPLLRMEWFIGGWRWRPDDEVRVKDEG